MIKSLTYLYLHISHDALSNVAQCFNILSSFTTNDFVLWPISLLALSWAIADIVAIGSSSALQHFAADRVTRQGAGKSYWNIFPSLWWIWLDCISHLSMSKEFASERIGQVSAHLHLVTRTFFDDLAIHLLQRSLWPRLPMRRDEQHHSFHQE